MFLTFTKSERGIPFRLSTRKDGRNLKIGFKRVSGRIGWYNVEEDLIWRYWINGVQFGDPTIQPGLYSFDELVKLFRSEIEELEISVDRKTGKINVTIPENHEILLPGRVRELFGLDDVGQLSRSYEGDHPVEFSPQRIAIYLKQLSTTGNILNGRENNWLGFVSLTNGSFGDYFFIDFPKPSFKKLTKIHELDFYFKIEFRKRVLKLDNHEQPLNLELEVK